MKYKTISSETEGFYKEKGSKFIALAIPVESVDAAKEHIKSLKTLHPKAVHVCFAWRIGIENYEDRYSDDGEPNNSAGKPIFGQILASELTNVLIAIVRYYGGTKLGVGGLVNAYKTAAKDALEKGKIVEKEEVVKAMIKFDPNNTSALMSTLSKMNLTAVNHGFKNNMHTVTVSIIKSRSKEIITIFTDSKIYEIELLS